MKTPPDLWDVIDQKMAAAMLDQHDRFEFLGGLVSVDRADDWPRNRWFVYVRGRDFLLWENAGRLAHGAFDSLAEALQVALNPRNHEKWEALPTSIVPKGTNHV